MNEGFTLKAPSLLCFLFSQTAKGRSFISEKIWLDNHQAHTNVHGGGILYDDGTYYWFDEHKTEGETGNVASVGVCCYSSDNLYHWNDHGIALSAIENDPEHIISKGYILERPKTIYDLHTKKYVMWSHLEPKGAGHSGTLSGIAVSDRMTGPYVLLKAVRPNAGSWPVSVLPVYKIVRRPSIEEERQCTGGNPPVHPDGLDVLGRDMGRGQMACDTNLFVDDDGKAYHIYSPEENSTLHIVELDSSCTGYTGKYTRVSIDRFMEASAMFKKDGNYYLIMSGYAGWSPNAARSAMASFIWGEWKELGNPCVGQGADLTFHLQSTYILPVWGKGDRFIYTGDRWTSQNATDERYIRLPIYFEGEKPAIKWRDSRTLNQKRTILSVMTVIKCCIVGVQMYLSKKETQLCSQVYKKLTKLRGLLAKNRIE